MAIYIDATSGRYINVANDGDQARPLSVALNAAMTQNLELGQRVRTPRALSLALEHEHVLVAWLNKYLRPLKLFVSNLHRDIRSGVALLKVLEQLSGYSLRDYHHHPQVEISCLQNLDLFLRFLDYLKVPRVHAAKPAHFYRGDMGVVFGQIFALMKRVIDKTALKKHLAGKNQQALVDRGRSIKLSVSRAHRFSVAPSNLAEAAKAVTSGAPSEQPQSQVLSSKKDSRNFSEVSRGTQRIERQLVFS